MPSIKLTKGELKKQRDSLHQYHRYLPTLRLKKQQLQSEILRQILIVSDRKVARGSMVRDVFVWAGLLTDRAVDIKAHLKPDSVKSALRNVAGVDVPVFESVVFTQADYDLFLTPPWIDAAIDAFRAIVALQEEIKVVEKGIAILKHELRATAQRVNLFEKVKIPEAEEAIKRIKIFIGDQMTGAVGRSKMAKRKIEEALMEGVFS